MDNNFSTLDRLMDFGLGMGMAQQMINMMNQTMQSMQLPQSSQPAIQKQNEWYVAIDNKASGPYTEAELKGLMLDKKVNKDTLVWCSGMKEWQKIEYTPAVLKMIIQLPPAL
jgi:membrane protease subunit (stomatin/prohibitin family)